MESLNVSRRRLNCSASAIISGNRVTVSLSLGVTDPRAFILTEDRMSPRISKSPHVETKRPIREGISEGCSPSPSVLKYPSSTSSGTGTRDG